MPVFFWTDILIYLLLLLGIGFGLYARRQEHLRSPWRQVLGSRVAMSSLVVLIVYVTIGLLDSLHFRPKLEHGNAEQHANQVLSVFDVLVTPIRTRTEKTYSAPFAAHLFAKETIELPDGRQVRLYPRLVYGGAHLENPTMDKWADILRRTALATAQGLGLWILLCGLFALFWSRNAGLPVSKAVRVLARGDTDARWRAALVTGGVLCVLGWVSAELGTAYHILGTDKVGEDVFYQSLKSVRTGLVIGTLTTLVMLPFAILLGIMAGYFRGWIDDVIQYIYTTLNSIPGVLLIAAAVLMLQVYLDNHAAEFTSIEERADLRLLFLCLILGVTSWTGLCRYLRGESLKLREIDYIQSARALGVGHFTIIARHILPNVMHIVLITVVLDFSGLVLAEAVLSYVQIGVDPTMNSWGNMINSARLEMAREPAVWWSLFAAFVFMFTLVLAANLFSDTVRDAFDPRLRHR
ncbi:MAG: ABC transporter permease [Gammaproteobacteria bacterium]|nr:ABC transporter permease [Gammaproteobacteria bacterium]